MGSLGGNTLGFARIIKQCSDKLREPSLLPGEPVDPDKPASECKDFFETGDGKEWLDYKYEQVEGELEEALQRMEYFSGRPARPGQLPRLVPADITKCLAAAPARASCLSPIFPRRPCPSWTRPNSG
ncbi:hypothetical protein ACFQ60_04450 [Streptomyces zhihengii]